MASEREGLSNLAYDVLMSGFKESDRTFFESGRYRFFMSMLNDLQQMMVIAKLRMLRAKVDWKIPPY